MKTLEITDEQYDALKEMQTELICQDNRSTRDPIYVIMDEEKIPTHEDYSDKYDWFDSENSETIGSSSDLFTFLADNYASELLKLFSQDSTFEIAPDFNWENVDDYEDVRVWFLTYMQDSFYDDNLSEFGCPQVRKVHYLYKSGIEHIQGMPVSFFEKDMYDHLKLNNYHYSDKAHTYACSLWRSRRMEKLRTILIELKLEN